MPYQVTEQAAGMGARCRKPNRRRIFVQVPVRKPRGSVASGGVARAARVEVSR